MPLWTERNETTARPTSSRPDPVRRELAPGGLSRSSSRHRDLSLSTSLATVVATPSALRALTDMRDTKRRHAARPTRPQSGGNPDLSEPRRIARPLLPPARDAHAHGAA